MGFYREIELASCEDPKLEFNGNKVSIFCGSYRNISVIANSVELQNSDQVHKKLRIDL